MRIAGVQMDVTLGDVSGNISRIIDRIRTTRSEGAELTIVPECAATGYCFDSLDEACQFAQPIPGPATEQIASECAKSGGYAVFGMIEADGDQVFNASVLVGGDGVIGSYRKVHLPYLGLDRFATPGDRPFAVQSAGDVKIGMHICYDGSFPEVPRTLMLQGAELLVLPTNWPPGAQCMAAHSANVRAAENCVYYAAVNRVGVERGFRFIGGSSICDPSGKTIAVAESTDEEILYATIDPEIARRKRLVRVPDKHLIDRLADRRPEMYTTLTEPHDLKPYGRD